MMGKPTKLAVFMSVWVLTVVLVLQHPVLLPGKASFDHAVSIISIIGFGIAIGAAVLSGRSGKIIAKDRPIAFWTILAICLFLEGTWILKAFGVSAPWDK